jgi:hypothetical protein
MTQIKRRNFHRFHNGSKAVLPFCNAEYETRLAGLRNILRDKGVNAAVFTSMHNIVYYLFGLFILCLWPSLRLGCHRNGLQPPVRRQRRRPAMAPQLC